MYGKMMSVQPANKTRGWGKLLVSLLGVMAGILSAAAGTLKWVGASGAAWNTTAQNWQDENGDPSAWVDGSIAEFGDDGGASIAASGTINLGGLVFKGTTRPTISGGTLHFAADNIDLHSFLLIIPDITASAHFIPSTAADIIPPAYPAPSPQGKMPLMLL